MGPDEHLALAVRSAATVIRPAKALLPRFVQDALGDADATVLVDDFDAALLCAAVEPGYLVMAADRFDLARPGVALFHGGAPREWSVYELCSGDWRAAWDRAAAKHEVPDTLPRWLGTTPIARALIPAFPGYELRAMRIDALDRGEPARFRGGRPFAERV